MYAVLRKDRIHNLSIKCQLDLLDKIVKPILLYKCEITNHRLPVEVGRWKKLLEETGSVIYVREENWEISITIFLNVLNLLMK